MEKEELKEKVEKTLMGVKKKINIFFITSILLLISITVFSLIWFSWKLTLLLMLLIWFINLENKIRHMSDSNEYIIREMEKKWRVKNDK